MIRFYQYQHSSRFSENLYALKNYFLLKKASNQESMQTSQSQSQKSKNILIRHSNTAKNNKNTQHSEVSYLLKYSPKYYKSLTLEVTPFIPLLSKIKKIKKLKEFTGTFPKRLPVKIWFTLLANSRKEIEENPQISPSQHKMKQSKWFWRKLNLEKIKFFPNMKRVLLPRWRVDYLMDDNDSFLSIKEPFVSYVWNMRRLKSIEILVAENYDKAKWTLEKLNGMKRLLGRLETFIMHVTTDSMNIQELFQNKNVFSHLTGLDLSANFDPVFVQIPQMCKNLESLHLYLQNGMHKSPEFPSFLTSLQNLLNLKNLEFGWPGDAKSVWSSFKPPPALQRLLLRFSASELINEGLLGEDVVSHWEDIQALKVLELNASWDTAEEMVFVKQFITMILKKVRRISSLKLWMMTPFAVDVPFFVKDVPHLYESLEKLRISQDDWFPKRDSPTKIDLSIMKPFRNLKKLKLEGNLVAYENVEEAVSLLQEGDKASLLKIKVGSMVDQSWLGETLKKIDSVKKGEKDLKMLFDLNFNSRRYVDILEKVWRGIQEVNFRKGLGICLTIHDSHDNSLMPVERVREILGKYVGICHLEIFLSNEAQSLEFKRLDGERESFCVENS